MSETTIATEEVRESAVDAPTTGPSSTSAVVTSRTRRPRSGSPLRSGKFITGVVLVVGITLFAIVVPLFAQDPTFTGNDSLQPPSADHWLGTTKLGNDMLAQLATGARGSLLVGVLAGGIAIALSLIFGVLAGYLAGWREDALALITNVMIVIPGLPLVMVIASFVSNRSWQLVAIILGITSWAGAAYVLRLQARSLRSRDYVYAAKVAGEKSWRTILVELMPNLLPLLTAQFLFAIIFAILNEAGLSYLGLGPNSSITWGTILNDAQSGQALSRGAWWWFIPPGVMIAGLGAGLALINFAIDEVINPKLRNAPQAARSVRKAAKAKGASA